MGAIGAGAAGIGNTIGGLAVNGAIWTLTVSANGALVVGLNYEGIFHTYQSGKHADWSGGGRSSDAKCYGNSPNPEDFITPKGRELSTHAWRRMNERGFTPKDIDRIIDSGKSAVQTDETLNTYLRSMNSTVIYDPITRVVVSVINGRSAIN